MKLRPRQEVFIDRCVAALHERGNTLGVAPTGAGKTVMLSGVAGRLEPPVLVIQHSDELVSQNRRTFFQVNKGWQTDLFTADRKRWARDGATFGMIQTLARNLDSFIPFRTVITDEAHHGAAASYIKAYARAKELNPEVKFFGVTATPNRGDKKALRGVYDNVADQITLKELIEGGFLVRPRTFVVDIGTQGALQGVPKGISDFDMAEVERIMDKEVLNDKVVSSWQELAGNRQTVVFAATVAHARHVCDSFVASGVGARVVHGDLPDTERRGILSAFDRREFQVLVNVAVLTEGWDCQPVSCVVLLRPSSFKSTMIQMIGRGLRKVDPERYPGAHKDDCIVIDFGTSILQHGSIEQEVQLDGKGGVKACPECGATLPAGCRECPLCGYAFPNTFEAPTKVCGECEAENPVSARVCKQCGHEFPRADRDALSDFVLTEIDLLKQSPYRWESLFDGGVVMVATAFDAWGCVVWYGGRWHAFGGSRDQGVRHIANEESKIVALAAADDHMREHGDDEGANKTKSWLRLPPTDKQLAHLSLTAGDAMLLKVNRYRAACCLTWKFNEKRMQSKLETLALVA